MSKIELPEIPGFDPSKVRNFNLSVDYIGELEDGDCYEGELNLEVEGEKSYEAKGHFRVEVKDSEEE